MKLRPLSDQIFCERVTLEQKSAGGIILVTDEQDNNRDTVFAKVVAIGPGKQVDGSGVIPTGIEVGELITYVPNGAMYKFKHEGVQLDVVRASMVIAVIEDVNVTTEALSSVNSASFKTLGQAREL